MQLKTFFEKICLLFIQVTRAALGREDSLDLEANRVCKVRKEALELRVTQAGLDLKDSRDSLVEVDPPEQRVHQVSRVSKVLQAVPESRVLPVILERLEILAFRVLEDSTVLQVPLETRDLVVSLEPPARVD